MSSCGRAVLGTQHWKHGKAITRKTFPHEEQRRSAAPASLDSSKSDHYVGDEGAMLSAKQAWRLRLARIPAPFFLMFYRFENCYAIQKPIARHSDLYLCSLPRMASCIRGLFRL